ncbi:hypothetical protein FKM82_021108 [Ascaphus truei]
MSLNKPQVTQQKVSFLILPYIGCCQEVLWSHCTSENTPGKKVHPLKQAREAHLSPMGQRQPGTVLYIQCVDKWSFIPKLSVDAAMISHP